MTVTLTRLMRILLMQAAVFVHVLFRAMILRTFGDMFFWIAAALGLGFARLSLVTA